MLSLRHPTECLDGIAARETCMRKRVIRPRVHILQQRGEPRAERLRPRRDHALEIDRMKRHRGAKCLQIERLVREDLALAELDESAERLHELDALREQN